MCQVKEQEEKWSTAVLTDCINRNTRFSVWCFLLNEVCCRNKAYSVEIDTTLPGRLSENTFYATIGCNFRGLRWRAKNVLDVAAATSVGVFYSLPCQRSFQSISRRNLFSDNLLAMCGFCNKNKGITIIQ